jgi:hypothetical protein
MTDRGLGRDDRAASISLNYTLSLVIMAMLLAGLFMGMNTFLENERRNAVTQESEVLANRMAADVAAVDRLAQTTAGPDPRVSIEVPVPSKVAGIDYVVTVTSTGVNKDGVDPKEYWDVNVSIAARSLEVNETVSLRTDNEVEFAEFGGGNYVVVYGGDSMEVVRD